MSNNSPCQLDQAALLALINLIGRDNFFDGLVNALVEHCGLTDFHIFQYRKDNPPTVLASHPLPVEHRQGLENFLKYTFVINPAYRAYQNGVEGGVYLISDFVRAGTTAQAPDDGIQVHRDEREPIGYRTPHWPRALNEVIMLVRLPNENALEFTFLTPLGSDLTQHRHKILSGVFPYIECVVQRCFQLTPAAFAIQSGENRREAKFQNFGADILTNREREVTQLVLVGHSSTSIALNLGIAMPTVKSHRRNIFAKMNISSQAELFNLFLEHLRD